MGKGGGGENIEILSCAAEQLAAALASKFVSFKDSFLCNFLLSSKQLLVWLYFYCPTRHSFSTAVDGLMMLLFEGLDGFSPGLSQ